MTLAASGLISLPLENGRTLLAASTNFRTWVDAEDAAAAKASIYIGAVPSSEDAPSSSLRPFALIQNSDPASPVVSAFSGGSRQFFIESGSFDLVFEADVAAGYADNYEQAEYEFSNTIGAILNDMLTLAGSGTYLLVRRIEAASPVARSHPDMVNSEGDYMQGKWKVQWGLEGE